MNYNHTSLFDVLNNKNSTQDLSVKCKYGKNNLLLCKWLFDKNNNCIYRIDLNYWCETKKSIKTYNLWQNNHIIISCHFYENGILQQETIWDKGNIIVVYEYNTNGILNRYARWDVNGNIMESYNCPYLSKIKLL